MGLIYRTFLKGLLTLLPISITVFFLVWITTGAEQALGEPFRQLPFYFPGAGVIAIFAVIFLTGLVVNHYLANRFFLWFEDAMTKAPVINKIYGPVKDLTHLFAKKDPSAAQRVVMIRLPAFGFEVIGLVTRDSFDDLPKGTILEGSIAVFIPFSYGFGGHTVIIPKTNVRETPLPADRALQLAITGWVKASQSSK